MPFFNPNFYYVSIVLQGICVYHCLRHGNQNKWIWIIVLLPFIGCLIYFFSEIVTMREIGRVQSGFGEFINPSGSIRKLENNLSFSDTFANRIALADAYLASGNSDRAISIYEESSKGAFEENEYVLSQLVVAYHRKRVYEKAVWAAEKIKRLPQFNFSHCHVLYADALAQTDAAAKAEAEFKAMNGKFSHYEGRYYYALFLLKEDRPDEAHQLLSDIVAESKHLSGGERRYYRQWLMRSKEEFKRLETVAG
jgi:hypothetical protein